MTLQGLYNHHDDHRHHDYYGRLPCHRPTPPSAMSVFQISLFVSGFALILFLFDIIGVLLVSISFFVTTLVAALRWRVQQPSIWLRAKRSAPSSSFVRSFPKSQPHRSPSKPHVDLNFRDIGGYVVTGGHKRVRNNVLYRGSLGLLSLSSKSSSQEEEAKDTLRSAGITRVFDIRLPFEVKKAPIDTMMPEGCRRVNVSVEEDMSVKEIVVHIADTIYTLFFNRHQVDDNMIGLYSSVVQRKTGWKRFFEELDRALENTNEGVDGDDGEGNGDGDGDGSPPVVILMGCSAGKERTGVAAAMILATLGVDTDTILAEYSLTNHSHDALFDRIVVDTGATAKIGIPNEDLRPVMMADPVWLESAIDSVRGGDLTRYLLEDVGVSAELLARIRGRLLMDV
eukprot:TRINITY_DN1072_c0_g1_i1.p1 TRINITY_DN1072_c0_g1~~TRINITY_DN1072_c0_g1_i1.p1  ORF type:complete len:397 (+),score=97.63 TRINITY_DN1072_c0_g1_i1:1786-2976(+)